MEVKKIDESVWQSFVDDCPSATFFHTPEWYAVWQEYLGYQYTANLLIFKNGKKVLFPYCWRKRMSGLMKEYISGPVGTYGGPLSNDSLNDREKNKINAYFQQIKLLQIRANPLNDIIEKSFFLKEDTTQMVKLEKDLNSITAKWSNNHLRSLKKGLKNNLQTKEAKQLSDWERYFEIYQDSLRRWGSNTSSNYDWELFDVLRKIDNKKCKLWLIQKEGRILSGCICFYFNQHVVYWHGASLESSFSMRPVHVLHYKIIENAMDNNFAWYDFNPSGGHSGVEQFKKGFGTVEMSTNVRSHQPFLIKKIFDVGRRLKKK